MEIRALLRAIPRSYDDFVDSTADWMERDPEIKRAILNQLKLYPESTPSDVLKVLWQYLGIGEPLKLVDDEEELALV
jgi:hypothetical protein